MTPYNPFALWAWPMQASAAFWSAYWTSMSRRMTLPLPPGAAEATDAAAAGAAAVTKAKSTPV